MKKFGFFGRKDKNPSDEYNEIEYFEDFDNIDISDLDDINLDDVDISDLDGLDLDNIDVSNPQNSVSGTAIEATQFNKPLDNPIDYDDSEDDETPADNDSIEQETSDNPCDDSPVIANDNVEGIPFDKPIENADGYEEIYEEYDEDDDDLENDSYEENAKNDELENDTNIAQDDSSSETSGSNSRITSINENYSDDDDDNDGNDILKNLSSRNIPLKGLLITLISIIIVFTAAYYIATTDYGIVGGIKRTIATNIFRIDEKVLDEKKAEKERKDKLEAVSFGKETNIIPFENASSSIFVVHNNKIIASKSNYLACFDKSGKVEWEVQTSIVDPLMSVSGRYILLAEKNGKKICLYKNNHLEYTASAENEIINANVSNIGDAVVITKKEFFKGAFEAFNKLGSRIYAWSSGKEYIVNAVISPSTRNIAVAFINTDAAVKSQVRIFDINQPNSIININFGETVSFGLEYIDSNLCIYTDCSVCGIDKKGKLLWRHMFDKNIKFISYNSDEAGNKIIQLSIDDKPELYIYSSRGKLKHKIQTEEFAGSLNINKNLIIYNSNRTITFGKFTSPKHCAASMAIQGLYVLSKDSCMVVYNNSIEFIKA